MASQAPSGPHSKPCRPVLWRKSITPALRTGSATSEPNGVWGLAWGIALTLFPARGRLWNLNLFVQSPLAGKQESWDFNPDLLHSEAQAFS